MDCCVQCNERPKAKWRKLCWKCTRLAYFERHPEAKVINLEKSRDWKKRNSVSVSEYDKVYRKQNKEKLHIYKNEYRKNNPNSRKGENKTRKLRFKKAFLKKYKKEIKELYKNCPNGYEVDHIIPLLNKNICGLHVPWNLQYLTPEENNLKNNSFDFTLENLSWKNKCQI